MSNLRKTLRTIVTWVVHEKTASSVHLIHTKYANTITYAQLHPDHSVSDPRDTV
jgi:hypothetical protein